MQAIAEPILSRTFRKARRAIAAGGLPDAVREVEALHQAREEILVATAAKMAAGRIGSFSAVIVPSDTEFRKRHPHWKRSLAKLCRLRIAEAEAELLLIVDEAKARLARYDYHDSETLEGDIVVRRARRRLAGLQSRLQCIESDPPDEAWQRHVGALLSDK